MPNVEVLPNTTKGAVTPGWAYVLDTGLDPSKQPIVPTGARKRARISNYASDTPITYNDPVNVTSREQARINKHLAELDRENHRDVQITVPDRPKDVAQRGLRSGKMTPGVKKILLSQKTWVNYLADEEAEIALRGHAQPQLSAPTKQESSAVKAAPPVKAAPAVKPAPAGTPAQVAKPAPVVKRGPGRPSNAARLLAAKAAAERDAMEVEATVASSQPPQDSATAEPVPADSNAQSLPPDIAYLTATHTPTLPSPAEIEALLSHPPLSYHAARAAPSKSTAPPRRFCEICGYWGRVKCMKCGMRVCGLECKAAHDETRCARF